MKKLFGEINKSIKKYKLYVLKDVALFIMITLVIHYSFRFWANQTHYWPIEQSMWKANDVMSQIVFNQSVWLVDNILRIPITTEDRTLLFENTGFITINHGCSGLKQILQFLLLMLVFPGPWKHKAWFIPMGILLVHFTNLFRITGLAVITITIPEHWDFAHDNIFRPFFYVVIFSLWVWWVEKFRKLPEREGGVADD
jgi:exosortase/archaeosortase family protein